MTKLSSIVSRYVPPFNFPMFILIMLADSVVFGLPSFVLTFGIDFFLTNGDPFVRRDSAFVSFVTLVLVVIIKILNNPRTENINEHKWVAIIYGIGGIVAFILSRMW